MEMHLVWSRIIQATVLPFYSKYQFFEMTSISDNRASEFCSMSSKGMRTEFAGNSCFKNPTVSCLPFLSQLQHARHIFFLSHLGCVFYRAGLWNSWLSVYLFPSKCSLSLAQPQCWPSTCRWCVAFEAHTAPSRSMDAQCTHFTSAALQAMRVWWTLWCTLLPHPGLQSSRRACPLFRGPITSRQYQRCMHGLFKLYPASVAASTTSTSAFIGRNPTPRWAWNLFMKIK